MSTHLGPRSPRSLASTSSAPRTNGSTPPPPPPPPPAGGSPVPPPPSLRAILGEFSSNGGGDRELLLGILGAKTAEEDVSRLNEGREGRGARRASSRRAQHRADPHPSFLSLFAHASASRPRWHTTPSYCSSRIRFHLHLHIHPTRCSHHRWLLHHTARPERLRLRRRARPTAYRHSPRRRTIPPHHATSPRHPMRP